MFTVNDSIIGKATGTPQQVFDWLARSSDEIVPTAVREYVTELYRLCDLVGLNADLLVAQSAHETADWTSVWFKGRLNPAGIGITGDPGQNADSHIWKNGIEAARGHIVHMAMYLWGHMSPAWFGPLGTYLNLDPRAQAIIDAGLGRTVTTLSDLTGKWAVDPNYATKIAAKASRIFPHAQPNPKPCWWDNDVKGE